VLLLGLGNHLEHNSLESFFPLCQEVINFSSQPTFPFENQESQSHQSASNPKICQRFLSFPVSEDEFNSLQKAAMIGLRLLHLFERFVDIWGWERDPVVLSNIFFVIPVISSFHDDGQLVLNPQWKDECISLESSKVYTIPPEDPPEYFAPSVVIYSFANLSEFFFLKDTGKKETQQVLALTMTRNNLVVQVSSQYQRCSLATWTSRTRLVQAKIRQMKQKLAGMRHEISALLKK
jgi:hypothetical protein